MTTTYTFYLSSYPSVGSMQYHTCYLYLFAQTHPLTLPRLPHCYSLFLHHSSVKPSLPLFVSSACFSLCNSLSPPFTSSTSPLPSLSLLPSPPSLQLVLSAVRRAVDVVHILVSHFNNEEKALLSLQTEQQVTQRR